MGVDTIVSMGDLEDDDESEIDIARTPKGSVLINSDHEMSI
jgi:hypothetical protein